MYPKLETRKDGIGIRWNSRCVVIAETLELAVENMFDCVVSRIDRDEAFARATRTKTADFRCK